MSHFIERKAGETLIVTLSNPPYNALNSDILEEGAARFNEIANDPPDGGVVLTGQHDDFTRGMDIKIAATLKGDEISRARNAIDIFVAALHRLPCALVSAVNGHAIGAGGIVCLASDWVVCARGEHKIGLPEAKAGLVYPPVAQAVLDHWLDPVWRRRMALSSQLLGPEGAMGAGFVDELVESEQLIDRACKRAAELMSQPGFRACKRQLRAKANAEIDARMEQV